MDLVNYPTDSTAMLINESAAKAMGFKNPVGQVIKDDEIAYHVVGVIKDFLLGSPYEPTKPMIIEGSKSGFNVITIKLLSARYNRSKLKRLLENSLKI